VELREHMPDIEHLQNLIDRVVNQQIAPCVWPALF
jgi:hypothetical protein